MCLTPYIRSFSNIFLALRCVYKLTYKSLCEKIFAELFEMTWCIKCPSSNFFLLLGYKYYMYAWGLWKKPCAYQPETTLCLDGHSVAMFTLLSAEGYKFSPKYIFSCMPCFDLWSPVVFATFIYWFLLLLTYFLRVWCVIISLVFVEMCFLSGFGKKAHGCLERMCIW